MYPPLLGGPLAVSKANNPQPLGLKSPALRGYLAVNAVNNPQLLGLYEAHSYPQLVGGSLCHVGQSLIDIVAILLW